MELLAIASIIGYGLYNSQQGRDSREDVRTYADIMGSGNGITEDYDVKPTDMVRKYRKKAENRWKQAQIPKESGIITPNMRPSEVMPFFTSGKTMNTNTDYKQRKMEAFTGATLDGFSTSGTYKHKKESSTMFGATPQGRVSSAGTVGNPAGDTELQKSRSIAARTHKNVLPAEQLRVGPGLGVGPEVAATGGFQQFYRQMPLNVGEYKLNQLPGRIIPGGVQTGGNGELPQISAVNHNPGALVIPYDERPPLATPNGAVLGRTEHGKEPRGYAGLRPYESGYEGPSDSIVEGMQARYLDKTKGRPRTGDAETTPIINIGAERTGIGGYAVDNMESVTLETQRGLINKFLGPAGPTGSIGTGGETRPMYVPETTLRESYEDVYYTGGAGTTIGAAERMDVVELQPELKTAKRGGQNRDYTPGAGPTGGSSNVFEPENMGAYSLIDKPRYDAYNHMLSTPVATTFGSVATDGKHERIGTKSTVENPYSSPGSLNIAERQLSPNRFNRDISKPGTLSMDPSQPFAQQITKPTAWNPNNMDVTPLWQQKRPKK